MTHGSRTRRWAALAAAAAMTLALAGCGDDETAEDPASSSSEEGGAAADLPEWAPAVETSGDDVVALDFTDTPEPGPELEVATITEGDGPPVEVGQTLTVDYFGAVYQGDEPFDSSYARDAPAEFPIGVGQLIPGWDTGIPGVPVGSRIIMSIPPDQGYGEEDRPGIPGGSTLFFVIDIIDAA